MKSQSLRHFLTTVALLSIAALGVPLWGDATPVKVVCIGDSITQGRGEKAPAGPQTYGWRYDLWKLSIDDNVPIEFVGTETQGFQTTSTYEDYKGQTFNNKHEAHWGWTTEAVFNKVKDTQSQWTADVALIYLGTNVEKLTDDEKAADPHAIAKTAAAMRGLVQLLQQNNPKMTILVRELLPGGDRSTGVNDAYRKLAAELSTPTSKVVTVPAPTDWQWDPKKPDTDTIDGCHSDKSGDQKIADGFWKAYRSLNP